MLIESPCDLCGSSEYSPLYPATLEHGESNASDYFSSSRNLAGHPPIVRCKKCTLIRTNPRDENSTLIEIYTRLEDASYEAENSNRMETSLAKLKWVEKFRARPGSLLDVGCATGIFMKQARTAGWQVAGVEPSRRSADQATKKLEGSQIQCKPIEEANFPSRSFDAITLWDVLEHLPSPTATLFQVNHWTKPDGWLFLNLPNASSLPARIMGKRWILFLREHLWYFSPKTMAELLEKCGYCLVAVRPNQVRFTLGTILERLGQYQIPTSIRINQLLSPYPRIANFSVHFPIGEMQVAAQKTKESSEVFA